MSEPTKSPSGLISRMIEVTVVLVFLIGCFIVAQPYLRDYLGVPISSSNSCINNLRQIDAAANEFALEHHLTNGDLISYPNDLTPYIKLNGAGKIPPCPQGGIYRISKVGEAPTCSIGATATPAHVLP